ILLPPSSNNLSGPGPTIVRSFSLMLSDEPREIVPRTLLAKPRTSPARAIAIAARRVQFVGQPSAASSRLLMRIVGCWKGKSVGAIVLSEVATPAAVAGAEMPSEMDIHR